jgi:YggT family protein
MRTKGYIGGPSRSLRLHLRVTHAYAEVNLQRGVTRLRKAGSGLTSDRDEWSEKMMVSLFQALTLILNVVWFIMIAHIVMSWLISFNVLNTRQPMIAQVWYGLNRVLEPVYAPIRRFLPQTPGLDFAPLVAFIGLIIVQRILINNAGFFYGY